MVEQLGILAPVGTWPWYAPTALSRIWKRVTVLIPNDEKHCKIGTFEMYDETCLLINKNMSDLSLSE